MTHGIVENLDFFDTEVYSEDIERLDPDEEEDVDPAKFEKRKEVFSLYENEMVNPRKEDEGKRDILEEFKGLEEDWEEFNQRDFESF